MKQENWQKSSKSLAPGGQLCIVTAMAYWRPAEIAPVVFLANANMAAIALEMITFLKAAFQVNRKS